MPEAQAARPVNVNVGGVPTSKQRHEEHLVNDGCFAFQLTGGAHYVYANDYVNLEHEVDLNLDATKGWSIEGGCRSRRKRLQVVGAELDYSYNKQRTRKDQLFIRLHVAQDHNPRNPRSTRLERTIPMFFNGPFTREDQQASKENKETNIAHLAVLLKVALTYGGVYVDSLLYKDVFYNRRSETIEVSYVIKFTGADILVIHVPPEATEKFKQMGDEQKRMLLSLLRAEQISADEQKRQSVPHSVQVSIEDSLMRRSHA